MQSVTLLITRMRFHNGELPVHGLSHVSDGFIKRRRRTARLDDDDDDADTFVSAFSPRAVATAPVVADT